MRAINVTNKSVTDITWLEPPACTFNIDNSVDIWSIPFDPALPMPEACMAVISAEEIARANRYYQQKDRNRFMISRWALRNIIAKYLHMQPKEIEFEAGMNKKPHIKNGGQYNLHYNLSHSAGNILLAISDAALGADIEFINTDFGYREVLADNFSSDEVTYINETNHLNRFFTLWTRKEAITKATAQGLDCDLRLLPALDGVYTVKPGIIASDHDWLINTFTINGRYAASIATAPSAPSLRFFCADVNNGGYLNMKQFL